MARVPHAADIAKVLPAALAEAGGSFTLTGLQKKLGQNSKFRIAGMSPERQVAYLHRTFQEAVDILIRGKVVESKDDRIVLTDRGWAQAEALGVKRRDTLDMAAVIETPAAVTDVTIDLSQALPLIELRRRDGTWIRGFLRDDAMKFQGRPFDGVASELLDTLYESKVNGFRSSEGFYSALKATGASESAVELLESKCGVHLVGFVKERRSSREVVAHLGRGGRPTRRPGITWERLVCEVLGELGGHADWPTIAEAIGRKPAAAEYVGWREESRQALRNHTTPAGRCYFEVAEIGAGTVFTLSEQGQRMAARRTEDERAPTLSKMIAKAVNPGESSKLTNYELYALFHLAVELGKPAEAEAIYHRLPENFPDEDRYYMARHLLGRAEDLRNGSS